LDDQITALDMKIYKISVAIQKLRDEKAVLDDARDATIAYQKVVMNALGMKEE
jgi:hypothetical protein